MSRALLKEIDELLVSGINDDIDALKEKIKTELAKHDTDILFVWDVYNADNRWLQTVTSPIGWDAHQVQELLVSQGYNKSIHVTLRHSSVLGQQPQQKPEPFQPDWTNYRQGKEDGRAEASDLLRTIKEYLDAGFMTSTSYPAEKAYVVNIKLPTLQQMQELHGALCDIQAAVKGTPSSRWLSKAALDVTEERRRQVEELGYDSENDDKYNNDLVHAAMWFVTNDDFMWPWGAKTLEHVKSKRHDKRARLVRASALLIAEIERMDRAAIAKALGDGV